MSTRVYGRSDDLVEFRGDVFGETGAFGTDDRDRGVLIVCSDGTLLEAKYGKGGAAVWGIAVLAAGTLLDRVEPCLDEDADLSSDVAHFRDGLKWAFAAKTWEKVG